MFKRGGTFYFQDSQTGEQKSLGTKNRAEAVRLLEIKRQTSENPGFNQFIFRTCLATQDGLLVKRTWQAAMDQMLIQGRDSTKERCQRALDNLRFARLRSKKIIETTADDFLKVLDSCPSSINHYLRRLHNLALGLGWLPFPILAPKLWPRIRVKEKRAITITEHEQILAAEKNAERQLYYRFLWEVGASQSDAAELTAANIDWTTSTLSFQRKKTGSWSHLVIGRTLEQIVKQLPTKGPLFPNISRISANDRAAEFYRRCKLLKITGVSLHSYRYAWAERAKNAGYPERFAQQALGHDSKAVHRAYARRAEPTVPPLEDYEECRQSGGELARHQKEGRC